MAMCSVIGCVVNHRNLEDAIDREEISIKLRKERQKRYREKNREVIRERIRNIYYKKRGNVQIRSGKADSHGESSNNVENKKKPRKERDRRYREKHREDIKQRHKEIRKRKKCAQESEGLHITGHQEDGEGSLSDTIERFENPQQNTNAALGTYVEDVPNPDVDVPSTSGAHSSYQQDMSANEHLMERFKNNQSSNNQRVCSQIDVMNASSSRTVEMTNKYDEYIDIKEHDILDQVHHTPLMGSVKTEPEEHEDGVEDYKLSHIKVESDFYFPEIPLHYDNIYDAKQIYNNIESKSQLKDLTLTNEVVGKVKHEKPEETITECNEEFVLMDIDQDINEKIKTEQYNETVEEAEYDKEYVKKEIIEESIIKIEFEEMITGIDTKVDIRESNNLSATMHVQVKDIGVELNNCKRFCKICYTLFPTEHAMNSHNLNHLNLPSSTKHGGTKIKTENCEENAKSLLKEKHVLNQCIKCKCITNEAASKHKCGVVPVYKCELCDLIMNKEMEDNHKNLHTKKFCMNNIILKGFCPIDLDKDNMGDTKFVCYRCAKCNLILTSGIDVNKHKCGKDKWFICRICRLIIPFKVESQHMMLHMERTFTENDINFIYFYPNEMKADNKIVFARCIKCKFIMATNNFSTHKCESTAGYTCHICGLEMSKRIIDTHIMLHNKRNFTQKDVTFNYFQPFPDKVKNKDPVESSKRFLVVKDEVIKITDEYCKEYKCHICGIEMSIELKDGHLMSHQNSDVSGIISNKMDAVNDLDEPIIWDRCANCMVVIAGQEFNNSRLHVCHATNRFKCHICGLVMSRWSKANHLNLHSERNFTEQEVIFEYFNPVGCKPENIVYDKCSKCNLVVTSHGAVKHVCDSDLPFKCHICELVMTSQMKNDHLKLHECRKFTDKDVKFNYFDPVENNMEDDIVYDRCSKCKIITPGNGANRKHKCKSDDKFKCRICKLVMSQCMKAKHKMLHKQRKFSEKEVTFKYFEPVDEIYDEIVYDRCSKCKYVMVSYSTTNVKLHKCNGVGKFKCKICGLEISKWAKTNHLILHSKRDFTEKDITFKYFDPVESQEDGKIIFERCSKCNYVVKVGHGATNIQLHRCDAAGRYKCTMCGLVMSDWAKANHLILHTERNFTEEDIIFKDFEPVEDKDDKDKSTKVEDTRSRKKTNAQKCKEYREKQKLQNIREQNTHGFDECYEGDQLLQVLLKKPKTDKERSKSYYDRQKLKKPQIKKTPKTAAQRSKEYREKKKLKQNYLLQMQNTDHLPISNNNLNLQMQICQHPEEIQQNNSFQAPYIQLSNCPDGSYLLS